jgi:hypothetical protein
MTNHLIFQPSVTVNGHAFAVGDYAALRLRNGSLHHGIIDAIYKRSERGRVKVAMGIYGVFASQLETAAPFVDDDPFDVACDETNATEVFESAA